jgi:hypothetical protein
MKWLEKALNVEHPEHDFIFPYDLKEKAHEIVSEGVKLFLPVIGPYYDGKTWSNPYDNEGIGTALKSGLDVAASGLPVSYVLFGDSPDFLTSWLLITGANTIALIYGNYIVDKEKNEGRGRYSRTGRAILE